MKTYVFHSIHDDYINEAVRNRQLTTFSARPAPVMPELPNLKQAHGYRLRQIIRHHFLQTGPVNIATLANLTGFTERAIRKCLKKYEEPKYDGKRKKGKHGKKGRDGGNKTRKDNNQDAPRFTCFGRILMKDRRWLVADLWGFSKQQMKAERAWQRAEILRLNPSLKPDDHRLERLSYQVSFPHVPPGRGMAWPTTAGYDPKKGELPLFAVDHHTARCAEIAGIFAHATGLCLRYRGINEPQVLVLLDPALRSIFDWHDPFQDKRSRQQKGKYPVSIPDFCIFSSHFCLRGEVQTSRIDPLKYALKMALVPATHSLLFLGEQEGLLPRKRSQNGPDKPVSDFKLDSFMKMVGEVKSAPNLKPQNELFRSLVDKQVLPLNAPLLWSKASGKRDLPQDAHRLMKGEDLSKFEKEWRTLMKAVFHFEKYADQVLPFFETSTHPKHGFTLEEAGKVLLEKGYFDYFCAPRIATVGRSDIRVRASVARYGAAWMMSGHGKGADTPSP